MLMSISTQGAKWKPSVSFCIITNGAKPDHLEQEILSIQALEIEDYEIIISGRPPENLIDVEKIIMPNEADTGNLGAMRNACCRKARKEIFVVCDDDMIFLPDFYEGICRFGPDFDLLACKLLNNDGTRFWDWAIKDDRVRGFGHQIIPYTLDHPYVYVTGGLCTIKRESFSRVQWSQEKGFYQDEDVEFSRRIKDSGLRINFNPYSTVVHDDNRYAQVDNAVQGEQNAFYWRQIEGGVVARGLHHLNGGNYWSGTKAELRFCPTEASITVNCVLSRYSICDSDEILAIRISSEGNVIGELALKEKSETAQLSLTLKSLANGFEISCTILDPHSGERKIDPVLCGFRISELQFVNLDKQGKVPLSELVSETLARTHIFFSILGTAELDRALREQIFSGSLKKNFSVEPLRVGAPILAQLSAEERNTLRLSSAQFDLPDSVMLIHDDSFVVGLNLIRKRNDRWNHCAYLGPASGLNELHIAEVSSGAMWLGSFSTEDHALIKSMEIPDDRNFYIPLLPRVNSASPSPTHIKKHRSDTIRIFVPLIHSPVRAEFELMSFVSEFLAIKENVIFSVLCPNKDVTTTISLRWNSALKSKFNDSANYLEIIPDDIADLDLEEKIRSSTIAIFLGEKDPFAYLLRRCLLNQVPVVGTFVGARKDIDADSGFFGVKSTSELKDSVLKMLQDLDIYEAQCSSFREQLLSLPTTIQLLEKLRNAMLS